MLHDFVVIIVRTRPRAIPLAMITIRKSTPGLSFVSHIWVAYGAPLGAITQDDITVDTGTVLALSPTMTFVIPPNCYTKYTLKYMGQFTFSHLTLSFKVQIMKSH